MIVGCFNEFIKNIALLIFPGFFVLNAELFYVCFPRFCWYKNHPLPDRKFCQLSVTITHESTIHVTVTFLMSQFVLLTKQVFLCYFLISSDEEVGILELQ